MSAREAATLSRRRFLQASGVAAGSLVLGCSSRGTSQVWSAAGDVAGEHGAFDAFLAITADDRILLHVHKVEMGQGTHTAFATLVGEELRTAPERIELVMAPVGSEFGRPMQITGGSKSLSSIWEPLRQTGARAREMLKSAAAARWNVDAAQVVVEDGRVLHPPSGWHASFGALAVAAAQQPAPRNPALTPAEAFRYIGRARPRVDAAAKVSGQAQYGMDVSVPGMRTAVVAHCPHVKGSLARFDASAAEAGPGVEAVFEVPGGVAIVADGYWNARSAAAKLDVVWDAGESAGVDSASIRAGLAAALDAGDLHSARDDGDALRALDDAPAERTVEAEYTLPFLAHATMEPMNCTVVPGDGGCDVYAGTQAPDSVQDAVAAELELPREAVRVHNVFLGGGFGRRVFTDMASEAARIARHTGQPVKLVWSREDDMARDYYRPPSLHRLRSALGEDGMPVAWHHQLALPSLLPYMSDAAGTAAPQWMRGAAVGLAGSVMRAIPRWLGPILGVEGASDQPYAVPNVSVESVAFDAGIPVGIWRSVGHSHNGFVVESFIDELAHAAGRDPAAYRRALLAGHPRHLGVLDALLEAAHWGSPAPGRFQGLAIHESFDSVAGQVAEVSVEAGRLRVHRVTCAIDCGLAVNPEIVKAQMESGIVFGLTAALFGEITFENGAAVQSNFHDHRMLRLAEAPEIEVVIVPSAAPPTGVGEPGTPPIAPAVANAVFAATGQRLRALPLRLS